MIQNYGTLSDLCFSQNCTIRRRSIREDRYPCSHTTLYVHDRRRGWCCAYTTFQIFILTITRYWKVRTRTQYCKPLALQEQKQ